MATVTGYTAARMKTIEDTTIVDGDVVLNDLILTRRDGIQINAGNVRGPQGIQGEPGPAFDLSGYVEPMHDFGSVGAVPLGDPAYTLTLDFSLNNVWRVDPTGAINVAFTGLPAAGNVAPGTLIVVNGVYPLTWPTGTRFPEGAAPEIQAETYLSMVAHPTYVVVGKAWGRVA